MSLTYRYPTQYQQQPSVAAAAPPNMSSQRFCLRWNNHQSNLLSVFDQLLHDESFVDVTLAVEGQLLKAHKMVLSACSPYFQALFVNHPDRHPIVILKDVPYNDMKSLLDFMYRGEVSVDQDRLTAFLRVAESLRIKGLTEVNEEKCDSITSSLAAGAQTQQSSHFQRLQQPVKRFGALNMLGNALLQPKRKRGRPRKLSGSSNGTPGADDFDKGDNLVQGSPEMLEVKMGMDGFTGNHSDSSCGNKEKEEDDNVRVKREGEPVAGPSKEAQQQQQFANSTPNSETTFKHQNKALPQFALLNLFILHDRLFSDDTDYREYDDTSRTDAPELPEAVTVELIPAKYHQESVIISTEAARNMLMEAQEHDDDYAEEITDGEGLTGVHFLTDDEAANVDNYERKKNELLEYITRDDGSVVCKLCGELLASRTHWYRHKYKFHVNNLINPAPLFKCKHCNVFFKSRKGYVGHVQARHADAPDAPPEEFQIVREVVESEPPKKVRRDAKSTEWEEQRLKEEKLVAAIIDRVRKECEAQGAAVTARGYSRRSTVMMNGA